MSFLKKDNRCKICKENRGNRFCLRIAKNICWNCCNEKRIDAKCSESCRYSLKTDVTFGVKTNADSTEEYADLIKKQIDKWMLSPQKTFNNKIPKDMLQNDVGKKEIEDFFSKVIFPSSVPLTYLHTKYKLDNHKVLHQTKNHEDIAKNFIEKIIEQNWQKTIYLLSYSLNGKYQKNYLNRISKNKILKKITEFKLISSAISQNQKEAVVYFELNKRYDLSLVLRKINDKWKIFAKIFGEPKIVNGETEAMKQIAMFLSQQKLTSAYELLKKYSAIYIDSADLHYYWGLFYSLSNLPKKAKVFYLNAIEIDSGFTEAKYNYAFTLHSENEIAKAKVEYLEILEQNAAETRSLNNLASIYIDENLPEKAKLLLHKCLKINPEMEMAKKNLEKINS
ncbi:MAG: hypothetical protein HN334_03630 [Candidatus Cloacimonetes bacterium]|nr:hypothetical protein [Candidatus Cloacimonadota bacterium]MBT7468931.1 hypothetical protein [Candidatus Cloacimonadota bacterium]